MFAKLKKKLQDESSGLPPGILSQVSGQSNNNNSSAGNVSVSIPSSSSSSMNQNINENHQALIHHHAVHHQNSQDRTTTSSSSSTTSRKTSSSDDVTTTTCALPKAAKLGTSHSMEVSNTPENDLYSKFKELADKLQERDRMIANLEVALENQQIASSKELRVLNEHFQEERSRVAELVAKAVAEKEEELRVKLQSQEISSKERGVDCKDESLNSNESRSRLKDAMETIALLQLKLKEKQNAEHVSSDHLADDWLEKQIESEKMISNLESELSAYKKKFQDSESEKRTLMRSLESKSAELSEANIEIASLKLQLETERRSFDACKDELKEKVARLNGVINDKELLRKEAEKLQQEKQRLKEEKEAVEREQMAAEGRHGDEMMLLRGRFSDLEREKNELKEEILKLKEEVSRTESEVTERMKISLEEAEEMIKEKTKVIKKQEQRLGDLKKLLQKEIVFKQRLGQHGNNSTAANNYHNNYHVSHVNFNNSNVSYDPSGFDTEEAYFNNSSDAEMADAAAQLKVSSSMTCLSMRRGSRTSHDNVDLTDDLNFKYLKHVVLKFLLSREHEALQLIKVVSMLLKFTPDEEKMIKDTLKWKTSWFRAKPTLPEKGQSAIVVPALY